MASLSFCVSREGYNIIILLEISEKEENLHNILCMMHKKMCMCLKD